MSMVQPAADKSCDSARRSALLLHGLGESDQRWLLERLTASQREQVSVLLEELRTLGIPADAGTAIQLLTDSRAAPPAEASARAIVAQASAARLAAVLKDEPAGLLAHLLLADRWAWQAAFIGLQPPVQRRRVQELVQSGSPGPKLAEAVVEQVAQRLTAAAASCRPDRADPPWRVWLRRLLAGGAQTGGAQ